MLFCKHTNVFCPRGRNIRSMRRRKYLCTLQKILTFFKGTSFTNRASFSRLYEAPRDEDSNRIESRRTWDVIDKKVKVPTRESLQMFTEHASQTFVNRYRLNSPFSSRALFVHVGQRRDVSLSSFANSLRETGARSVTSEVFREIILVVECVLDGSRYVYE